MANVLHVEATDMAKATGFFQKRVGPENVEYVVYLPSTWSHALTYGQVKSILDAVVLKDIEWDYVIVHDGDYSAPSITAFINLFRDSISFSPTARLNIPHWVGEEI